MPDQTLTPVTDRVVYYISLNKDVSRKKMLRLYSIMYAIILLVGLGLCQLYCIVT